MTIEQMLKNMGIKRIQTGTALISSGSSSITVAIDSIDPAKTLVLLNGGGYSLHDSTAKTVAHEAAYLSAKSAEKITISTYRTLSAAARVSYQIVEFK